MLDRGRAGSIPHWPLSCSWFSWDSGTSLQEYPVSLHQQLGTGLTGMAPMPGDSLDPTREAGLFVFSYPVALSILSLAGGYRWINTLFIRSSLCVYQERREEICEEDFLFHDVKCECFPVLRKKSAGSEKEVTQGVRSARAVRVGAGSGTWV